MAARFNQANVAIYAVDPGMNLTRGMLDRQALEILTGNTGGRSFANSDVRKAALQVVADAADVLLAAVRTDQRPPER